MVSASCAFQELEDPLILIHEKKISNLNAVVRVLELALKVIVGCLSIILAICK